MTQNLDFPMRIEGEPGFAAQSCDGHVLTAVSPRAFPPGRPLELVLVLPQGELPLSARTIGSKKRSDERFDLRIRLTNLRREARERLEQAFGGS